METILLTGATGLLGYEILHALLRENPGTRIIVFLRGDPQTAQKKFDYLCGELNREGFSSRVQPLWGDLEQESLGLSARDRDEIAEQIDFVVHSAAAVDFALPYSSARSANLDATIRLIDLAKRAKNLKGFAHISTAHVAGRRTGPIAESDLDNSQGFVNFYEQTKAETECFLRERMGELPIAVYRSTTLIGDSRTGEVRQFNFFHNAIRLYYHSLIPAIPGDPDGHLDLIPVDWAARAIRYLVMDNFHPGTTYHVCAGPMRSYTLRQLIDATSSASELSSSSNRHDIAKPAIVSHAQFESMLADAQERCHGKLKQLLKPLSYFMPHLLLPKIFLADNLERDLPMSGDLKVPDVRSYYPKVVDYCLRTKWGRS